MTRKEIEEPTEVEVELKRRLHQMTDHLIQKQAKVCLSCIRLAVMFLQILIQSYRVTEHIVQNLSCASKQK